MSYLPSLWIKCHNAEILNLVKGKCSVRFTARTITMIMNNVDVVVLLLLIIKEINKKKEMNIRDLRCIHWLFYEYGLYLFCRQTQ